ncbi:MAG: hypothetical protein HFJ10_05725 [Lachnospiraceae bacterium]|nr:hypothetical protein [Lachnospiraceae bacterium]
MPQINLGHVKGDPLTWEDLTEEQRLSLKGEKGDTPTVKAGKTTIVEYDQGAKVTSQTTGDVTSFDFQIPVGQEPPFYGAYANFPIPGNVNRTYIDDTVDPRLMYTWSAQEEKYILTGGAGGADGSSVDIPLTLPSTGWTGETSPYSQTVTVPQMRAGMTPLYFFSGTNDDAGYAFSLITGYETAYAQITFYAADLPEADIDLTLKGVPAQQLEFADNTVVVVVPLEGWTLNEDTQRYEQSIPVEGMTPGMGGLFDIVRSGPVLTVEESRIVANITDIIRLEGAIKIVCLEPPTAQYMLALYGTYTQATEGTTLLAGMEDWFDKVEATANNMSDEFDTTKAYAVGDYCIRENVLYKFTTSKETGEWDSTKVERTTVGGELEGVSAKILDFTVVNLGNIAVGNNGYYMYDAADLNKNILFATLDYWQSNSGAFSVNGYSRSIGIIAAPGTRIDGLLVKVWHYK